MRIWSVSGQAVSSPRLEAAVIVPPNQAEAGCGERPRPPAGLDWRRTTNIHVLLMVEVEFFELNSE